MEKSMELLGSSSEALAKEVVKVLLSKKAFNIKLFDVRDVSSVTDFYINVTGLSGTHVASLADDLAYLIGQRGVDAERIEGKRTNNWILVDYVNVIVNIFDRQSRDFYNLDRHFSDGHMVDISDLEDEIDKN